MRRSLIPFADPLVGGSGCVTWYALEESTGSAVATVELYDDGISSGQLLAPISLSPGQSTREFLTFHALSFTAGLWFKVLSGAVTGSVLVWVDHDCEAYLNLGRDLRLAEAATILGAN